MGLWSNALCPTWNFRIATAELENAYSGKNYSWLTVNYSCPKQFFQGFGLFFNSGFTSFINWEVEGKGKPKTDKKPQKQNRTEACPHNHPGLALVARKDSHELQSSLREAAAVPVVGQTDGQQGCGLDRGPGAAHGEEVVPTNFCILPVLTPCNPAWPLLGVALNCFPLPSCGGTLGPSRGKTEGIPRNGGDKDTE